MAKFSSRSSWTRMANNSNDNDKDHFKTAGHCWFELMEATLSQKGNGNNDYDDHHEHTFSLPRARQFVCFQVVQIE